MNNPNAKVFHIFPVGPLTPDNMKFKLMLESDTKPGTLIETGITGRSRAGLREIAHHALTANDDDCILIG